MVENYVYLNNMTTLPSCTYWRFTNSGLLIQDWLIQPIRPIQVGEFRSNKLNQIDEIKHYTRNTMQIILYFILPLIPAATVLIALANLIQETKFYSNFKRFFNQQLSNYLISFYILTSILSSTTWLISLPRYIALSNPLDKKHLESIDDWPTLESGHIRTSMQKPDLSNAPSFIVYLPALLTLQIGLNLAIGWLTIVLVIERLCTLNRLTNDQNDQYLILYIQYLYKFVTNKMNLIISNTNHDHFYYRFIKLNFNTIIFKLKYYFNLIWNKIKTCLKINQKDINYNFYYCLNCVNYFNPSIKTSPNIHPCASNLSCLNKIDFDPNKNNCFLGQTIGILMIILGSSIFICLSQFWYYKFQFNAILIRSNQLNVWTLINKTGKTMYEYTFGVISFLIPASILLILILILIYQLIQSRNNLKLIISKQFNMDNEKTIIYDFIIKVFLNNLVCDSVLIILIGIIQLGTKFPYFLFNFLTRLECLKQNQTESLIQFWFGSNFTSKERWLLIELNYLFGNFLIQLIALLICLLKTNLEKSYLNLNRQTFNLHLSDCKITSETKEIVEQFENFSLTMNSAQTSQNVSPLPISHTMSDVFLSPKFKSRNSISLKSNITPLPTPKLYRIPELIKSMEYGNQWTKNQQKLYENNTKTTNNYFVEPKRNMVNMTYSPRTRHPCRVFSSRINQVQTQSYEKNFGSTHNVGLNVTANSLNSSNTSNITYVSNIPNTRRFKLLNHEILNSPAVSRSFLREKFNLSPPPLPRPPRHLLNEFYTESDFVNHGLELIKSEKCKTDLSTLRKIDWG